MCECIRGIDDWTQKDCKAWLIVHDPEGPYSRNGIIEAMDVESARDIVRWTERVVMKCPRRRAS